MKRSLALLLAVLMLFAIFAGCGKKDGNKTGAKGADTAASGEVNASDKELRVAFEVQPISWQQLTMQVQSANVALQIDALYDRLVGYEASTGEIVPNLATEWKWVDDTVLEMKLRDDVTSINGDKFTANDVVYTIRTGANETTLDTYYKNLFDVDRCKAVDDYTVDIAVKTPYPFLVLDLAHTAYQMSVEASVEAAGGIQATRENPICGTGAYKMTEWVDGQYAKFERREDYWGKMPYYKTVYAYFVNDANTRAMGLEAGDYDIVQKPSSSACESLGALDAYQVRYNTNEQMVIMTLNTDRAPLNVKEVRQAMGLAIHYDAILDIACAGHGETVDSPYSHYNQAYTPADSSKPNYLGNTDVDKAKQLLKDAGYADGFNFEISYRSTDSVWQKSAEIVQNNLNEIGINCVLNPVESGVFYDISDTKNFDALIWTSNNPNPKRMLMNLDPKYPQCQAMNGWLQPGYTDLFDEAIIELDDAKRLELFGQINDLLRDEVCIIPLVHVYNSTLMIADIVNYGIDTYGNFNIESVYEADYLG